jgi:hypothetical protein
VRRVSSSSARRSRRSANAALRGHSGATEAKAISQTDRLADLLAAFGNGVITHEQFWMRMHEAGLDDANIDAYCAQHAHWSPDEGDDGVPDQRDDGDDGDAAWYLRLVGDVDITLMPDDDRKYGEGEDGVPTVGKPKSHATRQDQS